MKKCVHKIFMAMLLVALFSCEKEDHSLSELQGTIRFGGISLEFEPMGSLGGRIMDNSPWIHVFPNSADLVFINKTTGQQYVLKYNPNDFSMPYTISLPYGGYEYHSIVEGGTFSAFLPFEARGDFFLDKHSLEITLEAETEYGLVTVKNQYVEKAWVADGEQESDLVLHQESNYWFLYVKGGTSCTLNILESFQGSTISKELNIEAKRHYNFVLKLPEGAAAITGLILAPFELEEEEILLVLSTKFFDANGTIKCPGAIPGERGSVNDKIYEAVDSALLIKRRDEGADLSCVCTSLVTDMSDMFNNYKFFNQPIGNWDVSNVTSLSRMFFNAISFNQPIDNWNVSNVTDMSEMFSAAGSFNQPIGKWDVGKVTTMYGMFSATDSFNQPIGNWDVSNVTEMGRMFFSAINFNQPVGNWDVSNVTIMQLMFSGADIFNQPIGNWDVGNVTDMNGMFFTAFNFDQPIGNWDVSNVIDMGRIFGWSSFNQPIGNWDVSNVTNMFAMFSDTSFNQAIGNWDVGNVTDMGYMFRYAFVFNQPLGNWDVSNVTNMSVMFLDARSFNQPIGDWDVGNVKDMSSMFRQAKSFNQDLSSWCVQNIPSQPTDFSSESSLLDANKPVWGTCPD